MYTLVLFTFFELAKLRGTEGTKVFLPQDCFCLFCGYKKHIEFDIDKYFKLYQYTSAPLSDYNQPYLTALLFNGTVSRYFSRQPPAN